MRAPLAHSWRSCTPHGSEPRAQPQPPTTPSTTTARRPATPDRIPCKVRLHAYPLTSAGIWTGYPFSGGAIFLVSACIYARFSVLVAISCVQEMEGFGVKRDKLMFLHINGNQRLFNGFDQSVGQRKYPTETPSAYQQIGGFFASPVGDSISVWQRELDGP